MAIPRSPASPAAPAQGKLQTASTPGGSGSRKIVRELLGLSLLFWGLFVLLTLITYSAQDPGINHVVSATVPINNSGGMFGAHVSGLLVDLFGFAAFVWPLIFLAWGAGFVSTWFTMPWWRWLGFLILGGCFVSLGSAMSFGVGDVRGGGMLGASLYNWGRLQFSPAGSGLLWLFMMFIAMELAFGIQWMSLLQRGYGAVIETAEANDISIARIVDTVKRYTPLRKNDEPVFSLLDITVDDDSVQPPPMSYADTVGAALSQEAALAAEAAAVAAAAAVEAAAKAEEARLAQIRAEQSLLNQGLFEQGQVAQAQPVFMQPASFQSGHAPATQHVGHMQATHVAAQSALASFSGAQPVNLQTPQPVAPSAPVSAPATPVALGTPAVTPSSPLPDGFLGQARPVDLRAPVAPLPGLNGKNRGRQDELTSGLFTSLRGLFRKEEATVAPQFMPEPTITLLSSIIPDPALVAPDSVLPQHPQSYGAQPVVLQAAPTAPTAPVAPTPAPQVRPVAAPAPVPVPVTQAAPAAPAPPAAPAAPVPVAPAPAAVAMPLVAPSVPEEPTPTLRLLPPASSELPRNIPLSSLGNAHSNAGLAPSSSIQVDRPAQHLAFSVMPSAGFPESTPVPAAQSVSVAQPVALPSSLPVWAEAAPSLPPLALLQTATDSDRLPDAGLMAAKGEQLMACLNNFAIRAELVRITPGPVVTQFEIRPAPGTKVARIINLHQDLALALRAIAVRVHTIPGQDTLGIEIPNESRATVNFRRILESGTFQNAESLLTLALGADIGGAPVTADLAKMPHLLVGGATGSGKSVCINTLLLSLLYKAGPDDLKLLMIDPKVVELAMYADLPHLIHPVVTETSMAKNALDWAVHEMETRYNKLARAGVRNIAGYNQKIETGNLPPELADLERMPYLVLVVDELSDLMLSAGKDVETAIVRLAQLARACGIHLIIATQRPSVDVVTGLIKANFPSRIAFQVTSAHDSRTILDSVGAELLLGKGDMLFKPSGSKPRRLHGPFASDEDVQAVVDYWKSQCAPDYSLDFSEWGAPSADARNATGGDSSGLSDEETMYGEIVQFALEEGKKLSISKLQRRFRIGFNKAARFMERMQQEGIIQPPGHANRSRDVVN